MFESGRSNPTTFSIKSITCRHEHGLLFFGESITAEIRLISYLIDDFELEVYQRQVEGGNFVKIESRLKNAKPLTSVTVH